MAAPDPPLRHQQAQADRLGRHSARQFLGPGENTIDLKGKVFPAYRRGRGKIDAMRAEAGKREPLRLVSGTGAVFGLWVILRIREEGRAHLAGGTPRQIDFELQLGYYGKAADRAARG